MTTTSRPSAATWVLPAVAAGVLLAGCSVSAEVGSPAPKVSKQKLADTVSERLAASTGQARPHITCPDDLVGKVGSTTRCTLTASDGSTLGVTVKVTSVDGKDVEFDIKADETASPAAG
jgi:hypothetical protein